MGVITKERQKARTVNSIYKKLAVQWFNEALCFYQSLCLVDSEALRNPLLRQGPNRTLPASLLQKRTNLNIRKLLFISLSIIFFSCENKNEKKSVNPNQKAENYQNELTQIFENIFSGKNPKKEYVIGNWEKEKEERHYKYLGSVNTNKNENLTLINSIHYFGEVSKRAESMIMIFQDKDKYIGYYYIPVINDLPTKFENGILYFENIKNNCDENLETKIDFKNGIPKKIFRKCNGELGDLYNFEIDE